LGAVAKPAGSTAPTKTAAKTPRGTGASPAAAGPASGTNPSGANTVRRTSPAPQPDKPPATDSTAPKKSDNGGVAITETDASQNKSAGLQKKSAEPAPPPRDNSKPPSDES